MIHEMKTKEVLRSAKMITQVHQSGVQVSQYTDFRIGTNSDRHRVYEVLASDAIQA